MRGTDLTRTVRTGRAGSGFRIGGKAEEPQAGQALTSRLGREPQPAPRRERPHVEGADLDRARRLDRDDDAVLRHRGGNDAGALRQQRGDSAGAAGFPPP